MGNDDLLSRLIALAGLDPEIFAGNAEAVLTFVRMYFEQSDARIEAGQKAAAIWRAAAELTEAARQALERERDALIEERDAAVKRAAGVGGA